MPPSPPFRVTPAAPGVPVILSVPHAGRAYPPALLAASRLPPSTLRLLEDPLVDRLIEGAVAAGAGAIVADAPRALIDLNRSPADLNPGMTGRKRAERPSRRAEAGLGLIPTRLAGHGPIWRSLPEPLEVERRLARIYRPYHDMLAGILIAARDRYGAAVLLDCHSMPGRGDAALVLGDLHGRSCDPMLVEAAEAVCRANGLISARNDPYAGGEIVARHGDPGVGIHALQIEIDRSLYLTPGGMDGGPGLHAMTHLFTALSDAAAAVARRLGWPLAAE